MYIDDDAEDREFFKEAVKDIDPTLMCYMAQDGREGLNDLSEMIVMPDFIFVDVNMPIMNGRQFLIEILVKPNSLSKIQALVKSVLSAQLSHSERILGESNLKQKVI